MIFIPLFILRTISNNFNLNLTDFSRLLQVNFPSFCKDFHIHFPWRIFYSIEFYEMEGADKGRESTELGNSGNFPIEEEMVKDKQQPATLSHMEVDQNAREIREGASEEEANYESEQIPQQKVEQREELMQNVSKELSDSIGKEHEGAVGECQKESAVQAPTEKSDDVATEEISGPSKTIELFCVPNIGIIVEMVMNNLPAVSTPRSLCDEESAAWTAREQDVPQIVEPELEQIEQPEQELLVQQAQQMMELVQEEAVICDARQRMEKASDIEESQKYAFRGKENDEED